MRGAAAARADDDIERQRWHELTFNASVNAVSALTLRTPRDLLAVRETRALIFSAMREVAGGALACA